jgi:hypothetical protein
MALLGGGAYLAYQHGGDAARLASTAGRYAYNHLPDLSSLPSQASQLASTAYEYGTGGLSKVASAVEGSVASYLPDWESVKSYTPTAETLAGVTDAAKEWGTSMASTAMHWGRSASKAWHIDEGDTIFSAANAWEAAKTGLTVAKGVGTAYSVLSTVGKLVNK